MARPSSSSSTSSRQSSAQQASGTQASASEGGRLRRSVSTTKKEDDNEGEHDFAEIQSPFTSKPYPFDASLAPEGKRSLSGISSQSFWLGFALATSLILGSQAAWQGYPIWRLFAFTTSLSLFHFLEFWTTATYNAPQARASSFLLFSNGTAYNAAHSLALIEIVVSNFFFPTYQARYVNSTTISIGLFLVIVGQASRTLAMATAGTNFNHTPQKTKQNGHELVTSGIYAYSRHPSYFAFFWWAIGTQLLVGNKICFVAFFAVLWNFFNDRIKAEERSLVEFFGKDYENYKKRTRTGIPLIR
ncbi:hypothetical protein E2P81_ATG10153 [Venturia nashicola]|nr:hypothetical protein E2P81_ATG10153 [Venturia nashicola]